MSRRKRSHVTAENSYVPPPIYYFKSSKATGDPEMHQTSTLEAGDKEEMLGSSPEVIPDWPSPPMDQNLMQEYANPPTVKMRKPRQKRGIKRRPVHDIEVRELMEQAATILTKAGDEYDAFGVTIAAKLRRMSDLQRLLAERLFLEIGNRGLRDQLTEDTRICTRAPTAMPPSLSQQKHNGSLWMSSPVPHHGRSQMYPPVSPQDKNSLLL